MVTVLPVIATAFACGRLIVRRCLAAAGTLDPKALDSSVKRNSALIKKLRQLSEESKESLLSDIQKTNQSKYVSEAVAAITDASLKSKDIHAAVQICCALHQRYPDFHSQLVTALARICAPKAGQLLCHHTMHV